MLVKRVAAAALCASMITSAAWGQAMSGSDPEVAVGQSIEVREGDVWSSATVVAREGRRTQVRYSDGTTEWIGADRMRTPGTTAANDAAAPAAERDQFQVGQTVEAKDGSTWKTAKVQMRDGDLYLVILDGWENQIFWKWMHESMVRTPGSDKQGPRFAMGVGLAADSIMDAKAKAKTKFKNLESELQAEAQNLSPFDPLPYDKTITESDIDSAQELTLGPAGNPALDPGGEIAIDKRPVPLRGAAPATVHYRTHLAFAGGFAVVATANDQYKPTDVQLERVDLTNRTTSGGIEWDTLSVPVAIAPSGQFVLGRAPGFFPGTRHRVDLWDVSSLPNEPRHVVSFIPYRAQERQARDVAFAALLDDQHVLTTSAAGEVVLWSAGPATARSVWRLASGGNGQAALSPGRGQLAVMTASGLAILDPMSGNTLGLIPEARPVTMLDYTPDGKRVVGVSGAVMYVWDLETGAFSGGIALPGGVRSNTIACGDDGFVVVGGTHLFDLASKLPVARVSGANSEIDSHAGRCWTIAQSGQRRLLVSADIPDNSARQAAAKIKPESALALQPGGSVTLEIKVAGDAQQRQRVQDAIERQLRDNNITIKPGQPVKIIARTEDGETSQQVWQRNNYRGGPFGPGRETERVNVTEKITRVLIEVNGKTAWSSQTVNMPFGVVFSSPDQSIKQAVAEANQHDLSFLETVRIPVYVPNPLDDKSLAELKWTPAGLQ